MLAISMEFERLKSIANKQEVEENIGLGDICKYIFIDFP